MPFAGADIRMLDQRRLGLVGGTDQHLGALSLLVRVDDARMKPG
jgi:hypothetical protein